MNITKQVAVALTDIFKFPKKTPGQPGVFAVNPVVIFHVGGPARYAYWNGVAFGPIMQTVQEAFDFRFEKSDLGHTITSFRGLVE